MFAVAAPASPTAGEGGETVATPRGPDFDGLEAHPDYAALSSRQPAGGDRRRSHGISLVFFAAFAGISLWMARQTGSAVPIVFAFVGVALFVRTLARMRRDQQKPIRARGAYVVGKRTESQGDIARHHVTLELTGGGHCDAQVTPRQASAMAEGDMGVAYFRGERLIEFRAVRLDGR